MMLEPTATLIASGDKPVIAPLRRAERWAARADVRVQFAHVQTPNPLKMSGFQPK